MDSETWVTVGEFKIWPDSDTGSRPNDLRVEREGGERLVLYNYVIALQAAWGAEGWIIKSGVFKQLTPKESDMLRYVGVNLPPGLEILAKQTAFHLKERVDKIGTKRLEEVFEKVFKLCREEVRRVQRPRLLRWLPI